MTTRVAAHTMPDVPLLRDELPETMAACCEVGSAMAARELGGAATMLAGNCDDAYAGAHGTGGGGAYDGDICWGGYDCAGCCDDAEGIGCIGWVMPCASNCGTRAGRNACC